MCDLNDKQENKQREITITQRQKYDSTMSILLSYLLSELLVTLYREPLPPPPNSTHPCLCIIGFTL